jgi:hypothetical protein
MHFKVNFFCRAKLTTVLGQLVPFNFDDPVYTRKTIANNIIFVPPFLSINY